jgi:proteasome lid subunit RPN8/RPN11
MIQLSEQQTNEIAAHARREYPHECCGALLGRFGETGLKMVSLIYPITNAREGQSKRNRFLIQPADLMRVEKYAATKQLDVIGFYHSHPDHAAVPSQYDLVHAWPVYSYIVVAIEAGIPGELRSWELEPDRSRFNEEEVLSTKGRHQCQSQ